MKFDLVDMTQWDRREYYDHFTQTVVCTYSLTTNLDVTALQGQNLYPAMLWLLSSCVNMFQEFRTAHSEEGVGIFQDMHPSYTIFNKETKTFSNMFETNYNQID